MYRCGLNVADFNTYLTHLRSASVGLRAHASILAMDGTNLGTLGPIIGGQVNVDLTTSKQPVRSATLILSDPGHTMAFDSNSPASSASSIDRMIRLEHVTYVPALGRRVACPLITGPISGFDRNGTQVTMKIDGRDAVMLGQAWRTRTYRKGQPKTDVLRDLCQFYGGTTASGIPSLDARIPANISLARTSVPMATVLSLASSLNRQFFFDGHGLPQLRSHPTTPVLTLYQGDEGLHASDLVGDSQVSYGLASGWFNVAQVTGANSKIHAVAYPPPTSSLHPQNMNSGGAWRVELHQETNTHLRSVAEAQARANTLINQQLHQLVQPTAITKCFPMLEEGDFVRIATDSGSIDFRLQKFSIDLAGVGMSLGWNARFVSHRIARPSKRRAR